MEIAKSKTDLQAGINALRVQGKTIAFVPTMGALHEGHLSLVETAKANADTVVASIFVNPTQFGPKEDLDSYPRDEAEDIRKLESSGVDLVYLPSVEDIYPNGPKPDIHVEVNADILCGKSRPQFFHGIASVVKRLFEQIKPDIAVFGEKDYQQLQVIKWLVNKYNLPVKVIGSPLIRESDGLAMSSRNRYLSEEERKLAPELQKSLQNIKSGQPLENERERLEKLGFLVDYLETRNPQTLELTDESPARLFAAAMLGKTRLIDNIPM